MASWEGTAKKPAFQKTRDCPSIAGFLLNEPLPRGSQNKERNMNANRKIRARFGPETAFPVQPWLAVEYRAAQETRFEELKNRLLTEQLVQAWEPGLSSQLRRAAQEAAALACVTPFPLLVFPVLFEEKVANAGEQAERQAIVRQRSRELLAV
jgi:hypothetical protein